MALENRKSIELMHFPPDYSLTQAQDYLESATTDRWATLLTDNGIPATETPAYQTIIDIAPIAAPVQCGQRPGKRLQLLHRLPDPHGQGAEPAAQRLLPMVAFGAPVRNWIKQQYGQTVAVLGLAQISPAAGKTVSVLGSNHPSYIWYAADPEL